MTEVSDGSVGVRHADGDSTDIDIGILDDHVIAVLEGDPVDCTVRCVDTTVGDSRFVPAVLYLDHRISFLGLCRHGHVNVFYRDAMWRLGTVFYGLNPERLRRCIIVYPTVSHRESAGIRNSRIRKTDDAVRWVVGSSIEVDVVVLDVTVFENHSGLPLS